MSNALRKHWITGASLSAVLLVCGMSTAEARVMADDHGHSEERTAGEAVGDAWITTKVKSKLLADGDVSGFDISVETRDNVVHLSGEVENQSQVNHAVALARDTEGVARVDATELRVNTAVGQVRDAVSGSDDGFRSQPMSTQQPATPPPNEGYRDREHTEREHMDRDRTRADRMDVEDPDRTAGEAISDGWITTKVKSKLLADGDVSGLDITVETRDYIVHLSGEVETQAQIDQAVRLAADTEGVARVDASQLRIER